MPARAMDKRLIAAPAAPPELSAAPLLAAIDHFRGQFVDLDEQITVEPPALAQVRGALRQRLRGAGVCQGDRVVVAMGNGPRFVAALDAVLQVGAQPLLVHFQMPAPELLRTAARFSAAHLLLDAPEMLPIAGELGVAAPIALDWFRGLHVRLTSQPRPPVQDARPDGPLLHGTPLHPTSGSTGEPKVAVRPGRCAVAEAISYLSAIDVDHRDAVLTVTPMSHAYAYGMGMLVPLISHARIVSLRKFSVKPVLAALKEQAITILPAAPAMLDMLLFGSGGALLATPRLVLSAGAPLTRRTVERFQAATGRQLHPLYGTTETGGIAIGTRGVTPDNFASVGPPLAGVEAKIVAAEESALGGGAGRVAIRSTSMMAGYLSPDGIDRGPLPDGWFLTGDVGRTVDGEIHLLGRESDVINVGGLKVVPSEVEEVIAAFPGVVECKVYAGGSPRQTPFVKAAVVTLATCDLAHLRTYCSQQLVYYKQPTVFVQLERLPRSPAGKILKQALP